MWLGIFFLGYFALRYDTRVPTRGRDGILEALARATGCVVEVGSRSCNEPDLLMLMRHGGYVVSCTYD